MKEDTSKIIKVKRVVTRSELEEMFSPNGGSAVILSNDSVEIYNVLYCLKSPYSDKDYEELVSIVENDESILDKDKIRELIIGPDTPKNEIGSVY